MATIYWMCGFWWEKNDKNLEDHWQMVQELKIFFFNTPLWVAAKDFNEPSLHDHLCWIICDTCKPCPLPTFF